ncbi:MAG: hypothetical protein RLN59_02275 [Haliea sp.]|uniref:hypothetical protein n=1 Tax=Marinobacter salarius TaxID=1420917 RepID=UPI0032EF542A
MFICGGENIYPGQVETLLENHPAFANPRRIIILDALPLGGTHTVDCKALAAHLDKLSGVEESSQTEQHKDIIE